jgi:pimeloyl-ACP methyl ester carboxylesterase
MKTVLSKDGTRIAFDQSGKGGPIILVDGALCSRAFGPMSELVRLLANRFTVFSYDRRGRNASGDVVPYAVEREVEDLDGLITEAGGAARVFGLSSGAALALEAAASGLNIQKLALYEPPFMIDKDGHQPPIDHRAQLTKLVTSGRRGAAVTFFMTKVVGMPALFAFPMRLTPMWSKLKAVAHTLPYDAAIMGDYSLPKKRAASVSVLTLVMNGEKSPVPLRLGAQALANILPHVQRRVLKDQSHNISMKALAPVLEEFFAGEMGMITDLK